MDEAITYGRLLREGERLLEEAGIAEAKTDAWYLMSDAFGMERSRYYLCCNDPVREDEALGRFREWIGRRRQGVPVQYLTGRAAFMGMEFIVSPAVLIPRQDTEVLVETALSKIDGRTHVLDMCTGSGCIILSLAAISPDVTGCGADLSEEALEIAAGNRDQLGLTRIGMIRSNLFENITDTYDMIVSNPPYIRSGVIDTLMTEVKDHEPRMALDGGADGLDFYRALTEQAGAHLKAGGWLILEIGYDQASDVTRLMQEAGYREVTVVKDLPGLDRVVCGRK